MINMTWDSMYLIFSFLVVAVVLIVCVFIALELIIEWQQDKKEARRRVEEADQDNTAADQ